MSEQLSPEMLRHYEDAGEERRLSSGAGQLELARTWELLERYLPPPPARILDVGGGPGVYALLLAGRGYEVHLVDPVPLHVEQARRASERHAEHPLASVTIGDARRLDMSDASMGAVLMLGPLYHLTRQEERLAALREARRVLGDDGVVLAVGISRFASTLDGLRSGLLDDPRFGRIVSRDMTDGQHRNPTGDPRYFTTAFFHHPDELRLEVAEAGLELEALIGIEGPGWLLQDFDRWWEDPQRRDRLLAAIRSVESEPSLLGASAHLMAVGRRATRVSAKGAS